LATDRPDGVKLRIETVHGNARTPIVQHRWLIFLLGALVLPGAILGVSATVQSRAVPSDCAGRDAWTRDAAARLADAEGVAGAVDRLRGGASADALQSVANSYAQAASEQKASDPPPSDAKVNSLLVTYFQYMSDNWSGWIDNPYVSVHNYLQTQALDKALHDAQKAAEVHCS
jgi:hypothetical protein